MAIQFPCEYASKRSRKYISSCVKNERADKAALIRKMCSSFHQVTLAFPRRLLSSFLSLHNILCHWRATLSPPISLPFFSCLRYFRSRSATTSLSSCKFHPPSSLRSLYDFFHAWVASSRLGSRSSSNLNHPPRLFTNNVLDHRFHLNLTFVLYRVVGYSS